MDTQDYFQKCYSANRLRCVVGKLPGPLVHADGGPAHENTCQVMRVCAGGELTLPGLDEAGRVGAANVT